MRMDSTGGYLKRATRKFDKIAIESLAEYQLTPSQFKVLKFIQSHPEGTVRQIDIEEYFQMTNPTITGIVQNLEKKGLVIRHRHEEDKRCKIMGIGPEGERLLESYEALDASIEAELTKRLTGKQSEELRRLLKLLLGEDKS
ncbi:MAG: MarR family transcriptional regulator [Eubacteriales bacterium]|nr:MarR family transcriptional regulator [Eubacteriales bacterium]